MNRRPIQDAGVAWSIARWCKAGILACMLAIVGVSLAIAGTPPHWEPATPVEIVAQRSADVVPAPASHQARTSCAVQAVCAGILLATGGPAALVSRRLATMLARSESGAGRTTGPLSPPPKPFLPA